MYPIFLINFLENSVVDPTDHALSLHAFPTFITSEGSLIPNVGGITKSVNYPRAVLTDKFRKDMAIEECRSAYFADFLFFLSG